MQVKSARRQTVSVMESKKIQTHDADIREPLFEFLDERFGKNRILEEKTMGKSRADVVMVLPDALCGIEIKSDADTYQRLASQVKDYDQYYDRNIVVVGTSHAAHIAEHVPSYWGIITVELVNDVWDFYVLREAQQNPEMKWKKKMEILWRPELAMIQQHHDMPKYKDKSKAFVTEKILALVPERMTAEELSREISDILFERDYTAVRQQLKEYRKGEIERALETEEDPYKRLDLMIRQAKARANLPKRRRRRRRRRSGL